MAKLILLSEVHAKLVVPGSHGPLAQSSFDKLMKKLGIKAVRKQIGGKGYFYAFITAKQGDALVEEFRRIHWLKFKRVQGIE